MKKDLKILVFLTCLFVVVYFTVPNFQSYLSDNASAEDSTTNSLDETVEHLNTSDEEIILNFDIVRISKHGDAVIAGKSSPNLNIKLLDNNQVLSSLRTDANGEWIWVSDIPLNKGIKKFRLMYVNKDGEKKISDQIIIVFNKYEKNSKPRVIKFLESNQKNVNLLNTEPLSNGLSLDMVNYDPSGELFFSGRSLPDNEILFFDSNKKIFHSSQSDDNGNWSFSSNISHLSMNELIISTNIGGQKVEILFGQEDLKKIINHGNIVIKEKKITIQPGNSLWRIARKTLGGGVFYTQIYENNSKLIKDPNLIYPGQVFILPKINNQF